MSEYLDTTKEQLVYEIEVDTNFDKPKTPEPNAYTVSVRVILEKLVMERTQQLQNKINEIDRKLKMLLGEN